MTSTRSKKITVGELIDKVYQARAKRLALERQVEELKLAEVDLKQQVIDTLRAGKLESARGKLATATVGKRRRLIVENWSMFWTWARKDKGGNYVQKRVASEAVNEWLSEHKGGVVPGLGYFDDWELSLTKASDKGKTR